MQGNPGAASLHVVCTRITALDATGAPAIGNLMYVTDTLVKFDFNPEIEAGTESTQKNAAGAVCTSWKQPDVLKRLAVSIQVCHPDPELEALLAGGTLFVSGSGSSQVLQGYQYPKMFVDPVPNGVSVEFWTHAIVDGEIWPTHPYMHWAFPRVSNLHHTNRTLDENPLANAFDGKANENSNWGSGPGGTFTYDTSAAAQWIYADTFPTPALGTVPVAA